MKSKLLFLLLLTSGLCLSQNFLSKIWVGNNQEFLEFKSDSAYFDHGYGYLGWEFEYSEDTLNLFYFGKAFWRDTFITRFDHKFKIQEIQDSLILWPTYEGQFREFEIGKAIRFIDYKTILPIDLKFSNLFFETKPDDKDFPIEQFKLEINANRTVLSKT